METRKSKPPKEFKDWLWDAKDQSGHQAKFRDFYEADVTLHWDRVKSGWYLIFWNEYHPSLSQKGRTAVMPSKMLWAIFVTYTLTGEIPDGPDET